MIHKNLNLMLSDMQKQSPLYQPTSFWIEASSVIIAELKDKEIKDFRSFSSSLNMFAPTYTFPGYLGEKNQFNKTKQTLEEESPDIKSKLKFDLDKDGTFIITEMSNQQLDTMV